MTKPSNDDSDDELLSDDHDPDGGSACVLPPQAGNCEEASKWRSAIRRVRKEHEIIKVEVMDIRHKLYGNGSPGFFEQVRNHEDILKDQKASRKEFRGWAMGILATIIGAAILIVLKLN